jgi:p-hydroxybenzoate 3-monooxygenase
MVHHGISLRFDGADHRIAFDDLVGRSITVYGQQEVVKDLIAARVAPIEFEVSDVALHDLHGRPRITYRTADGTDASLECDLIAGCDGFHGISRDTIPAAALSVFERTYPFAWLGILAQAPPSHEELIYAYHPRGFALHSMRSPSITRMYLQVRPDEDIAEWPDDRIWAELQRRLAADGFTLTEGPILEKSVTGMRSYVVEPCTTASSSSPATPPTSCRPPAPRA